MTPPRGFTILMAEDSEHDIRAVRRVWKVRENARPLRIVRDGVECMDYLLRRGAWADPEAAPFPDLLLLDLNMPRMDGFGVLERVKRLPELRGLPVVILSDSDDAEEIARCYALGANAYLTKPVGPDKLNDLFDRLNRFWEIVTPASAR